MKLTAQAEPVEMMQATEFRQHTGSKLALAFMLVTTLTVAGCGDETPTQTRPAPEVGIVVAE